VSIEEQERRRKAVHEALINTRLENLEPDPVFFEYAERYVRGEMTVAEAVADYLAQAKTDQAG